MSNRDILKNGLENLGISVDDKMLNDFNNISKDVIENEFLGNEAVSKYTSTVLYRPTSSSFESSVTTLAVRITRSR